MRRLCIALVLASLAWGQSDDVPVIRVQSQLVNVPVNVVDAHGAPIGSLEQSDFEVFEDNKPQKIAIFEKNATTPLSMVMAVDTSESVITQFKTEHDAAHEFVRSMLREQDEMDLMGFSDQVNEVVPYTNDAHKMEEGLNHLRKGTETHLYDAIYLASQRLTESRKDAARRRVLVLITDGGNNGGRGMHYAQAVEAAQRAGVAIYPIILVPIEADAGRNVAGEHALIQMAEDTGGKYFYVLEKQDLKKAFAHLSDDLRTQYLLGYYAPHHGWNNAGKDSGQHTIEVKLTHADDSMRLRFRTAYYPAP